MKKVINQKNFLKINAITLGSVLVLILVGSIVRVMGAGMGCPDWPKCFGAYVPPTSAEGLPDNYQDIFKEQRMAKNIRLAGVLSSLGYQELSEKITNDPTVLEAHDFNVQKAWIEYINRLIGVLIGLLVFLNMIFSFAFKKHSTWIPIIGIAIFLITGFQGWVGSLVVSTNLLHGFITVHMLLALVMVAMLIWMNVKVRSLDSVRHTSMFLLSLFTTLLFIPQIILGTEVRGVIDDMLVSTIGRNEWAQHLTTSFLIHRSYSWLILIGTIAMFYYAKKTRVEWLIMKCKQLLGLVLLAVVAGVAMIWFDFPFWIQPLHLIVAVGIFSLLFYVNLRVRLAQ